MKKLAILLTALAIASVRVYAQSVNSKVLINTGSANGQNGLLLIGKWGQYALEWTGRKRVETNKLAAMREQLLCNVCPTIVFQADSTGIVRAATGEGERFKWWLIGNKLTVKNIYLLHKDATSRLLGDGEYSIVRNQKELLFIELLLVDSKGIRHVLRR